MNLKISHKLLLLVTVPLFFELVFVGALYYLLDQTEQERAREAHARDLSKHLNRVHQILLTAIAYDSSEVISGEEPDGTPRKSSFGDMFRQEFADIEKLVAGHPEEQHELNQVKSRLFDTWVEMQKIRVEWKEAGAVASLAYIKKVKPTFRAIVRDIDGLVAVEERIERESPIIQRKQRELIKGVLVGGIVFNIALALFLALYFNRGITNRLAVLLDNIRRHGANLPLTQLSGNDELSEVDRAFKDMVSKLKAAKRKEQAILANFVLLLESLPVGVLLLKRDGEVELANLALSNMLGYEDSPVKKNVRDLVYLTDASGKPVKMPDGEDEKVWCETDAISRDGNSVPVELGLRNIETPDGEKVLAIMVDITQRREVERLKQEFLSMVSHDLRTPLNSIQAFFELVADGIYGDLNEAGSKKVSLLEAEVGRLMRLIQQLLDLDRLQSGAVKLSIQNIEVASLVEASVNSVRSLADSRGIEIEVLGSPLSVKADADKIIQVLVNLLSNAIKFSPDYSTITVSVVRQGSQAIFKVLDRGRGIPIEAQAVIFERFKQVRKSDATRKGGTGLGLAICRTIIEQHGGKIGVESQEGAGSTFWFKLPVA